MSGLSCAVLLLSSPAKNVDDLLYSPTHLRWTSRGVDLLSVLTNFDASRHASSPPSPMVHLVQVVEVAQTQRVSETTNKICLARCVCPYQTLQECSTAFFYCLPVTVLSTCVAVVVDTLLCQFTMPQGLLRLLKLTPCGLVQTSAQ